MSKSTLGATIWDALLGFAAEHGHKPSRDEAIDLINRMVKEGTTIKGGDCDADFLAHLEQQECYRFIDVKRELGKCQAWASVNKAQVTRRRFIAWLNRAEKTIGYDARGKSSADAKAPQRPSKPVFTLSNGPDAPTWRHTLRYGMIPLNLTPHEIDGYCDLDSWADLAADVRTAILKVI